MKIRAIRFTTAFPGGIGQQFDDTDAQKIDVQAFPHIVIVDAWRPATGIPTTHFRLHIPWSQIMFIRED